ncbi:MAG: hypothetical protein HOV80_19235 [Polyangiaceae bacterium]|nr:hypothetical protein [Polyangiaceae bacterium]
MEGLLENAACNRDKREPWVELAAELKRRGDVRGELADVQLALEDARGTTFRELLFAEERLLNERSDELWGPLAQVGPMHPGSFHWRRGFLDSILVPGVSVILHQGQRTREEPLPRELFARALEHDVGRLARYVMGARKPKRAPTWTEEFGATQMVLTRDVMALPLLRGLWVWTLVAGVPLVHPTLERATLPCTGPTLGLLEAAQLPALKQLTLTRVAEAREGLARLAQAVSKLTPDHVSLGLQGPYGPRAWTPDDLRALEPIADRIEALDLRLPIPSIDFQLPRLRRLTLALTTSHGVVGSGAPLPALPPVEELHVSLRGGGGAAAPVGALRDSAALHSARVLHLEADDRFVAEIAAKPLPRLEELAVITMGLRHLDFSDAVFAKDSFPNVRTVSIGATEQLPGLVSSPLADRIETLSIHLMNAKAVSAWLDVREKLPGLRTLVVRGMRAFDAATRASLYDAGHEVIWARSNSEAHREVQEGRRTEPGFPVRF